MTDKTTAQLDEEIRDLRSDLDKKVDPDTLAGLARIADVKKAALKGSGEEIATQKWVQSETKSKIWEEIKSPEILGLVAALTIVKFELTPFLSLEPVIEEMFKKKGLERNKFGVMWKVQAEELQRRAREIAAVESRLAKMEKGIGKLQDLAVGAHSKIRNSNTRIQSLERKVSRIDRAANTARQQVRHMDSSSALSGTTNQVTLLERRVGLLASALS
ncbi:hypothetical protein [Streptomyces sp. NPDC050988]|uniref:hypothetical protein n=1 Tax=Streptomyces sp. NPDC050988 TaxID=3365637 RepID=UPI0037A8F438